MRSLGPFLRDAWLLSRPYFFSEERWSARLLLASIVAMNLLLVGMTVVLNYWHNAFYDSLQSKDWSAFLTLLLTYRGGAAGFMPGFVWIATVYIVIAVYARYIQSWLQIRWRRWMTARFTDEWLSDQAYYRISLTGTDTAAGAGTDNPDQRIAEDVRDFTASALSLALDLMSNVVTLFSFMGVLWGLSGPLHVGGVTIPGYLVWVALVYAALGTWATHLVGRPLAMLRFRQQRFEANYRFALVRVRENTEGVALYGGEKEEKAGLGTRFSSVYDNFIDIMKRTKLLNSLITGYSQVSGIFPFFVVAPRYFFGTMKLGGLMQTVGAFSQVQSAMSWFIDAYAGLAEWRATTERLATFHRAVVAARAIEGRGVSLQDDPAGALVLDGVTLALPDGSRLLDAAHLDVPAGQSTSISGRSGSGKSTLLRAIAGIWPFGSGTIRRPAGRYLFLPQRPYIPLGTLRHIVTYPQPPGSFDDGQILAALHDAGLDGLDDALDDDSPWGQRLSGGEQQRLAVARALLLQPDWLFLDEATANLDPDAETTLYRTLRARLPNSTLVSVAHREAVTDLHDAHIVFDRKPGLAGRLAETAPA